MSSDPRPLPPTWRQLHPGEDLRVEAVQFAGFREATPAEKMRRLGRLNATARGLALVGLRRRNPEASPALLRRLLAELLFGAEMAGRIFGPHFSANGSETAHPGSK